MLKKRNTQPTKEDAEIQNSGRKRFRRPNEAVQPNSRQKR